MCFCRFPCCFRCNPPTFAALPQVFAVSPAVFAAPPQLLPLSPRSTPQVAINFIAFARAPSGTRSLSLVSLFPFGFAYANDEFKFAGA